MTPSMSKTKFWKLVKEKNLILWKHDYSKLQAKWDILYTNMGLSNRHFISQPLGQNIIIFWNKSKFSDFKNDQKQILKQGNFSGKSPPEMKMFVVIEIKKGTIHVRCRGWFPARPSFWKLFWPTKCMWSLASTLPQRTSSRGWFPWEIFLLQYLFLVISEIIKFSFVSNCDYSLLEWLAYDVSVTHLCIKNISFGLEFPVVMFPKYKNFHLFC